MLLLVSGSPRSDSANSRLLRATGNLYPGEVTEAGYLANLPIFQPERDRAPWPEAVLQWRSDVARATALTFSTPAYLHNLPGVLKNALDWLASSGELSGKPVLVFSFTPHPPRGDRARQSLLWSLQALKANVVAESPLYQQEVTFLASGDLAPGDQQALLQAAVDLLP